MTETLIFLKTHLNQHFTIYFFFLYVLGGRPAAIFAALAVDKNVFYLVPAVVFFDATQIPFFFYFYETVSQRTFVRKLAQRSQKKMERVQHSKFIRRLQYLGPPGVIAVAMLPFKGCGMWSGVLLSKLLQFPRRTSYMLLITGSLLGCLLLVAMGAAAFELIEP